MNDTPLWAVNVDCLDFKNRRFMGTPPEKTVLIRIGDPCFDFALPQGVSPLVWAGVYTFEFLDVDEPENEFAIREDQAAELANVLRNAAANRFHVVVHCYAGIARSGAVVEFLTRHLGYTDVEGVYRNPNILVLNSLEKAAGVAITETTSMFVRRPEDEWA